MLSRTFVLFLMLFRIFVLFYLYHIPNSNVLLPHIEKKEKYIFMCKITKFQLTNTHSDSIIKIRKVPPLNRLYRRFALDIVTKKQLYLGDGRLLFLCSFRSRSLNTKSPVDEIAPTTLAMLCILQKHKCIHPHPVNIFI